MTTAGWTISIIAIVVAGVIAWRWERDARQRDEDEHPRSDPTRDEQSRQA